MLYRKIDKYIVSHLQSGSDKILIVDGARQIGKSYIIREIGKKLFPNYIEVNMETDKLGDRTFADARTVDDFYLALSALAGDRMKEKDNTLVFIDEIQAYDHLLTLLKFLREDNKFTYIASGSLLGVTLKTTSSVPLGSIIIRHMYPLDFEEFLIANGIGQLVLDTIRKKFAARSRCRKPFTTNCLICSRSICWLEDCQMRSTNFWQPRILRPFVPFRMKSIISMEWMRLVMRRCIIA